MNLYKSYSFKDKDPVIDELRILVERSRMSWGEVAEKSGVSSTTIYNWFQGSTLRPQFATAMAVARACGGTFKIVKQRGK